MYDTEWPILCWCHHHHHRQPWAQRSLVSDAIVTNAAHHCLSRAAWLNSCRVAPHHYSMSSDHSRWGRPFLFEPSIIPNTRVFIFLLCPFCRYGRKSATFSVSLSADVPLRNYSLTHSPVTVSSEILSCSSGCLYQLVMCISLCVFQHWENTLLHTGVDIQRCEAKIRSIFIL